MLGNFDCESPSRYTRKYEERIDDMVAALPNVNADERFATLAVKVNLDAVESVKMSIGDMGAALPKEAQRYCHGIAEGSRFR